MIIDFHNHFYPEAYIAALGKGKTKATVEKDKKGRTLMAYAGDYNVIVHHHRDPAARLEALDAVGVDKQVLTLTLPGVYFEEKNTAAQLAQITNDAFAEIIATHPHRYTALAALPLQDPQASVQELERAITQLDLPGAMLFTHVHGQPLDSPEFLPLFEKAVELGAVLFLHPCVPMQLGLMGEYRLVPLLGFLHDTSVAISRLVFSGLFEKLPSLNMVLSHMGGTIPFVIERMDLGFQVYPECRKKLNASPSETLKNFYVDTIPHAPKAIAFAAQFYGADKVLLGSDYPHQIGDLPGTLETVAQLPLSEDEKKNILGENAARLLKLHTVNHS